MPLTFVGDSLTAGWHGKHGRVCARQFPPDTAILGYPGLRPETIAARLPLHRIRGTAVVMAGVNSFTLASDPPQIARDVQALVQLVQTRADRVLLCAILPATLWGRNEWPRIQIANRVLAETPAVIWVDATPAFVRGDRVIGRCFVDGMHLSATGYRRLYAALRPALSLPALSWPTRAWIEATTALVQVATWLRRALSRAPQST